MKFHYLLILTLLTSTLVLANNQQFIPLEAGDDQLIIMPLDDNQNYPLGWSPFPGAPVRGDVIVVFGQEVTPEQVIVVGTGSLLVIVVLFSFIFITIKKKKRNSPIHQIIPLT